MCYVQGNQNINFDIATQIEVFYVGERYTMSYLRHKGSLSCCELPHALCAPVSTCDHNVMQNNTGPQFSKEKDGQVLMVHDIDDNDIVVNGTTTAQG